MRPSHACGWLTEPTRMLAPPCGKRLHPGYKIDGMHEYRNVTPIGWGEQFVFRALASAAGMRLIAERGGLE